MHIHDGHLAMPFPIAVSAMAARRDGLEGRRLELEAKAKSSAAPAPRLHPNLAEVFRQRIAALTEVLTQDNGADASELVRGLVESITLVPEAGKLRIEVRGALGGILRLAEGARTGKRADAAAADVLCEQVKMVAGTQNHRELILRPVTG